MGSRSGFGGHNESDENFDTSFEASGGSVGLGLTPPVVMAGGASLAPTRRPVYEAADRGQRAGMSATLGTGTGSGYQYGDMSDLQASGVDEEDDVVEEDSAAETHGRVLNIGALATVEADVKVEEDDAVGEEALALARAAAATKSTAEQMRELFPVGTRVTAAYMGGDDWFPGKVSP